MACGTEVGMASAKVLNPTYPDCAAKVASEVSLDVVALEQKNVPALALSVAWACLGTRCPRSFAVVCCVYGVYCLCDWVCPWVSYNLGVEEVVPWIGGLHGWFEALFEEGRDLDDGWYFDLRSDCDPYVVSGGLSKLSHSGGVFGDFWPWSDWSGG